MQQRVSGGWGTPKLTVKGEQASGKHLRGFAHSLFGLYLVLNTLNMYSNHFKNNLSRVRNYSFKHISSKSLQKYDEKTCCCVDLRKYTRCGFDACPSWGDGVYGGACAGAHSAGRRGAPDQESASWRLGRSS